MAALTALQRKRTRIGLDIGAGGVRAVQLTRQAQSGGLDRYVLTNAACGDRRPSEPGAQATGQCADRSPKIEESDGLGHRSLILDLRSLGLRAGFRGKAVATALSPPDVEFHTLELPAAALRTEEVEAAQIVRFEVERLMSNTHAPVETRHWRLPPTSVPAPNAIGAGAAHEIINATMEVCAKAGFTCSHLDTTATALTRFGVALQSRPKEQVWGVLDVGDRQARLVLCLDDTPILVRTVGAGGRAWTQRIADALQVSFKAAEIHKRDHGIALTGRQSVLVRESILAPAAGEGTRSELASLILGAVRADLNDLASEVKRSYEYVLSCYPGRQAADLVLCGGGSLLHYFPEFLGNSLGIPVRRASNYLQSESCRLRFLAERNTPLEVLAVAVGLAIADPLRPPLLRGEAGGSMVTVNLIPESAQAAQIRRRHFKHWAACLVLSTGIAVVPVGAHWMKHLRIDELRAKSDKLQIDLASARTELKTATAAANDSFLRIERAKALRTKRAWSDMLALIGACLPKDCWLTSIATDPEVPSAAPLVRKTPPATAPPAGMGEERGSTPTPAKPVVVIIDAPRKLRMIGEATDATQPLFFVTRLKESQVFREVTLERSLRENAEVESNFRFELICEW